MAINIPKTVEQLQVVSPEERQQIRAQIAERARQAFKALNPDTTEDRTVSYVSQQLDSFETLFDGEAEIASIALSLLPRSYELSRAVLAARSLSRYYDRIATEPTWKHAFNYPVEVLKTGLYGPRQVYQFKIDAESEGSPNAFTKAIEYANDYQGIRANYLERSGKQESPDAVVTFEQFRSNDPVAAGIAFLYNFDDFATANLALANQNES